MIPKDDSDDCNVADEHDTPSPKDEIPIEPFILNLEKG